MNARTVIGLEIHLRPRTRAKLFCGCAVDPDAAPNTVVCPVCLGLPGALPTLNAEAVSAAVRLAVACGAAIAPSSSFARKQYAYPDLPRNYQITQHDEPLARGGRVTIGPPGGRVAIPLIRMHLEDDAAKLVHRSDACAVDFNRAGAPLLEIVTEPVLSDPAEARLFVLEVRRLARWYGVSDARMEAGSLRCDANISLRDPATGRPGERVELKNLNSASAVAKALDHERSRQAALLEERRPVHAETRSWDPRSGRTVALRAKESAPEYRYVPEPDLPPLCVDDVVVAAASRDLPEPPHGREDRMIADDDLPVERAVVLCASRERADDFATLAEAVADVRTAADFYVGDLTAAAARRGLEPQDLDVTAGALADLLALRSCGAITDEQRRRLLEAMLEGGGDPAALMRERGLGVETDRAVLSAAVARVVAAHPDQVARCRDGAAGLLDWFVGRALGELSGRADPATLKAMLAEELGLEI